MLSNQVLSRTVQDITAITGASCSIWNMKPVCVVHTDDKALKLKETVEKFIQTRSEQDILIEKSYALFFVCDEMQPEYVLVLDGLTGPEQTILVQGRLCVSQLQNLIAAYKERLDRRRFIQNVLLAQLPVLEIYNQARKLRIDNEALRAVFIIEAKQEDAIILETVKGIYASGTKDFVTAIDGEHIILVKALETTEGYKDLDDTAEGLVDTLNTEAMVTVRVAYGTIVKELKELPRSFEEAKMALDVGRVFYVERSVLAYKELGIGRLIHQLPMSLCNVFLDEVFAGRAEDQFEEETLAAVNKFFEHNLNISETARQLYLHRNTLMYRLEKIQKQTGLDVRTFDDAVTFKIAMMVSKHIKYTTDLGGKEE